MMSLGRTGRTRHILLLIFKQEYGIGYETFALVAEMTTIRTLPAVANIGLSFRWAVKNDFLHGNLCEVVYMTLIPGYSHLPIMVG